MNARPPSAYRAILFTPWQRWINRSSPAQRAFAVAMPLIAIALVGFTARSVQISIAGTAMVVVISVWLTLVVSLLGQNRPNQARLVPGHVRRLRIALAGGWLVASVALAAMLGAAFGHPVLWLALSGAALLALAWAMAQPLLWIVVSQAWVVLNHRDEVRAGFDAQPLLCIGLVLLAAAWSFTSLIQAGGARHARRYAARERTQALWQPECTGSAWRRGGGWLAVFAGFSGATYRAWLTRRSASRSGSVMSRALIALGPRLHWSGQVGLVGFYLGLALLVVGLIAIIWGLPLARISPAVVLGPSWGVMVLLLQPAVKVSSLMHSTRREQVLLMLLPGMPRGAAQSRLLLRHLTLQFGVAWLIGLAITLAMAWRVDAALGGHEATQMALLVALAVLPLGTMYWRDWARVAAPGGAGFAGSEMLLPLAIGLAELCAAKWWGAEFTELALFSLAITLVLGAWRLHAVRRAPQALPVGRLA